MELFIKSSCARYIDHVLCDAMKSSMKDDFSAMNSSYVSCVIIKIVHELLDSQSINSTSLHIFSLQAAETLRATNGDLDMAIALLTQ
jgi:predicted metal-dependent TIM-barrel fold hydrolase